MVNSKAGGWITHRQFENCTISKISTVSAFTQIVEVFSHDTIGSAKMSVDDKFKVVRSISAPFSINAGASPAAVKDCVSIAARQLHREIYAPIQDEVARLRFFLHSRNYEKCIEAIARLSRALEMEGL